LRSAKPETKVEMSSFWTRPAFLIVLPATAAWALALSTRPVLWATQVGGARHNPLGNAVGHQLMVLGFLCLSVHALLTFARNSGYDMPWKYTSSADRSVALAFADGLVVVLLYVVAFSAWRFTAGS
jgi:hypothetical protein